MSRPRRLSDGDAVGGAGDSDEEAGWSFANAGRRFSRLVSAPLGARLSTGTEREGLLGVTETPFLGRYKRYHHNPADPTKKPGFGVFVAVCFTVNFIVGSGFLGVPKVFVDAGVGLGLVLMLLLTLICNLTKDYLLECMARAEAVTEFALKRAARMSGEPGSESPMMKGKGGQKGALASLVAAPVEYNSGAIPTYDLPGPGPLDPIAERSASQETPSRAASGHAAGEASPLMGGLAGAGAVQMRSTSTAGSGGAGAEGKAHAGVGAAGRAVGMGMGGYRADSAPTTQGSEVRVVDSKMIRSSSFVTHTYTITQRKFELTELAGVFLGLKWKRFVTLMVALNIYGVLWAYGSVFAASAAAYIPVVFLNHGEVCSVYEDYEGCFWNYHLFLLVFACVVVPMSCLELKEQVALQVTLSAARVLVMGLLVLTVVAAEDCSAEGNFAFRGVEPHAGHGVPLFQPTGMGALVPVAVYAQLMHLAIPVLSQPVEKKKHLNRIFAFSFTFTFACYCVIGAVLALYFGPHMVGQCNLLWEHYLGCTSAASAPTYSAQWYIRVMGYIVLVFPALDVMSAYPLNAITLGNNMLGAWVGEGGRVEKAETDRRTVIFFRLVASMPPIVGAALIINLDSILSYTGLISFWIAFYLPCMIVSAARERCADMWPSDAGRKTPYDAPVDPWWLSTFILVLMVFVGIYIAVSLVLTDAGVHVPYVTP